MITRVAVVLVALASLATAFTPTRIAPPVLTSARVRPITATPAGDVAVAMSRPLAVARRVSEPARMGLFGLGWGEIGVIGVLALLFFGPERLAPLAKDLGVHCHNWCALLLFFA